MLACSKTGDFASVLSSTLARVYNNTPRDAPVLELSPGDQERRRHGEKQGAHPQGKPHHPPPAPRAPPVAPPDTPDAVGQGAGLEASLGLEGGPAGRVAEGG